MHDLRFYDDRDSLKKILERSVSTTAQDKCLILVEVTGVTQGRIVQKTYCSTVYNQEVAGRHFGAIQVTTAAGVCGALDLLLTGKLGKRSGMVKAEDIPLAEFLNNEFGRHFKDEKALRALR
jgi:saccharopine dehydrogenase-like NADP-dependent oxidoreductase